MQTALKFNLKRESHKEFWWLIIPAYGAFFGALGLFIISSIYDLQIAIVLGDFFHQPFGKLLAHWSVLTGNKSLFLALVPAVMIIIECYFAKAKVYKRESFFGRHQNIPWLIYGIFFAVFIGVNIGEILHQRFADRGWGPGVNVTYLESYEPIVAIKSVIFVFNFAYYLGALYLIHYRWGRNQRLAQSDLWIPSVKILLFSIMIYFMVGVTKIAMNRPYYFSNIYHENPWGGKTIIEEMAEAGFGYPDPTKETYRQLPYMEWWQPFHPFPNWHEIIPFVFDPSIMNADFPSGHMASTAILLSLVFYGLEQPRKSPTHRITVAFYYLMLLQFSIVTVGMVIHRFHWMSDMAFTMIFNVLFLWFVHVKVNFWSQSGFFRKYLPLLTKNDKIKVALHSGRTTA